MSHKMYRIELEGKLITRVWAEKIEDAIDALQTQHKYYNNGKECDVSKYKIIIE
jgi:hypothetical protein